MSRRKPFLLPCLCLFLLSNLQFSPAIALVPPEGDDPWRARAVQSDALQVESLRVLAADLPETDRADLLSGLGADPGQAWLDLRGERWATLLLSEPLLPGNGKGNSLTWQDFGESGAPGHEALQTLAWKHFLAWIKTHQTVLRIDPDELEGRATVDAEGRLVRIYAARHVAGIPVLGTALTAVIRQGNLILFGVERWGDLEISLEPSIDAASADATVRRYLDPLEILDWRSEPRLAAVATAPVAPGSDRYGHRLIWQLEPKSDHPLAHWRAWVDAHSGEVLRFYDHAHYAREVKGGVFPVSNDGEDPGGQEIAGFPMPYLEVESDNGTAIADGGGNVQGVAGEMRTALNGQYVVVDNVCGDILEATTTTTLDLGSGAGSDCAVPPGASAGNTASVRTSYYELNRILEVARGQLPNNPWFEEPLLLFANRDFFCNAGFGEGLVLTSISNEECRNTGEISSVLVHEFGHGIDYNDATGTISQSAEGIADIYAALRQNDSCIGRGLRRDVDCPGFGNPCLDCTGIRDIDWELREAQIPTDVDWANANCGGSPHCDGAVYSEAVWDLLRRDLPSLYGHDNNTALEIVTRLTYLGGGNVLTWYEGENGSAGCGATGGYLQYLAADDDNGDLADGTPHMAAIFAAFDRHGIACPTPTVQDSGCGDRPTAAPEVTATPTDFGIRLEWAPVPGAGRYKVYRTESPLACDFGKILLGETTDTQMLVSELQRGRQQSFVVAAFGASDSCMGPASTCASQVAGPVSFFADGFESGDCSAWSSGSC